MKNFLTLTQEFNSLKKEYDFKEAQFLKEILFYLADACFELDKVNKEQGLTYNLVSEINFEIKNYTGLTLLYLDIRFNCYEDNVSVAQGKNHHIYQNHPNPIKAQLFEFISNTIAEESVCYLLSNWLRHHYDKLKINLRPTNGNEMLDKQFIQLFGESFSIEYEKHLLEKSIAIHNSDSSSNTKNKLKI